MNETAEKVLTSCIVWFAHTTSVARDTRQPGTKSHNTYRISQNT